jgi:hypothetical protein
MVPSKGFKGTRVPASIRARSPPIFCCKEVNTWHTLLQAGESVELSEANIIEALMAEFPHDHYRKPEPIRQAVCWKKTRRSSAEHV